MRLVMKQDDGSQDARNSKGGAGRRVRASMKRWAMGRASRKRVAALSRQVASVRPGSGYSVPLPWEATVDTIPSKVSTAWCGDAVTLQAAIKAGVPFIVVPRGAEGAALLQAATARLGESVSITHTGRSTGKTLSASQVVTALGGGTDPDGEASSVARALVERGCEAKHILVVVDEAGKLSIEALAFLHRLSEVRTADAPAVQLAFSGGSSFFMLLADGRFNAIRENLRSEVGADFEYDPNAPEVASLTGGQRAGMAVGMMTVFCLMVAPLVPWHTLPSFEGHATTAIQVAEAPVTPPPNAVLVTMATVASVENSPEMLARQKQEFSAALEARGPAARHLSQAERDRLFRNYMARHQEPVVRSGMMPADRHV